MKILIKCISSGMPQQILICNVDAHSHPESKIKEFTKKNGEQKKDIEREKKDNQI